jgi:hypothetical protein
LQRKCVSLQERDVCWWLLDINVKLLNAQRELLPVKSVIIFIYFLLKDYNIYSVDTLKEMFSACAYLAYFRENNERKSAYGCFLNELDETRFDCYCHLKISFFNTCLYWCSEDLSSVAYIDLENELWNFDIINFAM